MSELSADGPRAVNFTLNGRSATGHAEPRMLLTDFLRQIMGQTDVHASCEHGVCGSCTIRLDGEPARACLTFAVQVDGRRVDTVQSLLGAKGELNDIQRAFRKHHGLQCGYCTPGIMMSVAAFLETNADPTEQQVREMLSGHLCRCTGYVGMVRAVLEVAATRRAQPAGGS
ncbi:MAG: (2Fe-2S)-binding protein [Burkholderiales bacterium]|nr:(2Fe-2S)-binding protein [Burkholderiales bacterium]